MENAVTDTEELGLFGEMDIEDIPDDPWYIAAGTYYAAVTESKRVVTKQGNPALIINYTIDEPDNEFHGQTKGDFFQLFPNIKYKDLDADQKKVVIRMKARLREAFDKTEEEIPKVKPSELIGEKVYITITENAGKGEHEGKTFYNISKVVSKRLWEEENEGKPDGSMSSVGLSGM